jgi:hypothetical protein
MAGKIEEEISYERERRKFEKCVSKHWQCLVRKNSMVNEQLTSPQPPEP